jgi:hypothetical protein
MIILIHFLWPEWAAPSPPSDNSTGYACLLDRPTLKMDLPSGWSNPQNVPSLCKEWPQQLPWFLLQNLSTCSTLLQPRFKLLQTSPSVPQESANGFCSILSCLDVSLLLNMTAGASTDANSGEF